MRGGGFKAAGRVVYGDVEMGASQMSSPLKEN